MLHRCPGRPLYLSWSLIALASCGLNARQVAEMQVEREPKKMVKNMESLVEYFEDPVRDPITGGMAMSAMVEISHAWSAPAEDQKLGERGGAAVESVHQCLDVLTDGVDVDQKRITKAGGNPEESARYLRGWAIASLGALDPARHRDHLITCLAHPDLIADRNAQFGVVRALLDLESDLRSDDNLAATVLAKAAKVAVVHPDESDQIWLLRLADATLRPATFVPLLQSGPLTIDDEDPVFAVAIEWGLRRIEAWAADPKSAPVDGAKLSQVLAACALRPQASITVRRNCGQRIAAMDPAGLIPLYCFLVDSSTPHLIVAEAVEHLAVARASLYGASPTGRPALAPSVLHGKSSAEEVRSLLRQRLPLLLDGGFLAASLPVPRRAAALAHWGDLEPDLVLRHLTGAGLGDRISPTILRLHLNQLGRLAMGDDEVALAAARSLAHEAAIAARQRPEAEEFFGQLDTLLPPALASIQAEGGRALLAEAGPALSTIARWYRSALVDLHQAEGWNAQAAADGYVPALQHHDPKVLAVVAHSADILGAEVVLRSLAKALLIEGQTPGAQELVLMRDLARASADSDDATLRQDIFTGLLRNVGSEHEEVSLLCASLLLELYGGDADRVETMTPSILERWPTLLGDT